MEIKGEEKIAAPRNIVWRVLNDTEALLPCIDGCEKLERISENRIDAVLKVNLGLLALRFHGSLVLSDINPPVSYTIAGEGRGAISGLATGKTHVRLEEFVEEGRPQTKLCYAMHGTAGGRLAQLGGKVLSKVARKISARFFAKLAQACEKAAVENKSKN